MKCFGNFYIVIKQQPELQKTNRDIQNICLEQFDYNEYNQFILNLITNKDMTLYRCYGNHAPEYCSIFEVISYSPIFL